MADGRPGLFQFDRDAESSPRRLAILIGTGLAALLLLLWLFSGDDFSARDAAQPAPAPSAAPPAVSASEPVATPTASVAELRLHGVMGTGEGGAAIVSTGAGPQRLVRVGRDVVPGVPLLAVAADHILVRESGREVRLAFAEDGQGGSTVSTATPGASSRSGPRGDEASRREALEYQAALAPYRVDGRSVGFQFRTGSMPEMFREAGVQDGDVVLRVGGLGLEDADDVAGIPRRIRERGRVEIEILRDGQPQTIMLDAR